MDNKEYMKSNAWLLSKLSRTLDTLVCRGLDENLKLTRNGVIQIVFLRDYLSGEIAELAEKYKQEYGEDVFKENWEMESVFTKEE